MKRRRITLFLITALLVPAALTACVRIPGLTPTGTPSAQPDVTSVAPPSDTATAVPPSATDWHSGVKTDYSGLTPYEPPAEKYTRLKEGPLPDLIPGRYGKLLPYVGEILYADRGFYAIRQYGLVTDSGMIVTDPVYSGAYQGFSYSYSNYISTSVPAFSLEKTPEQIDKENPWNSHTYAACASDGSWITPFDYKSIFFAETVILLTRDNETNDIDIMDYSGSCSTTQSRSAAIPIFRPALATLSQAVTARALSLCR